MTYTKNTIITYHDALNILGSINASYPWKFQACCSQEKFNKRQRFAYWFIDECIAWDDYPQYGWANIHGEVKRLFDTNWDMRKTETFEERIARRLAYEEQVRNLQRVTDFNTEALRIAEKAKKKIDKKLQEFNEELLNGNAD